MIKLFYLLTLSLLLSIPLFGWELNHRLGPTNLKVVKASLSFTNRLQTVPKAEGVSPFFSLPITPIIHFIVRPGSTLNNIAGRYYKRSQIANESRLFVGIKPTGNTS